MESGSGGTGTDFNVEVRSEVVRKSPVFPFPVVLLFQKSGYELVSYNV